MTRVNSEKGFCKHELTCVPSCSVSSQGQVSVKAGEAVIIDEEQDDGWCTISKRDETVGFVPVAYLDKSKNKKKGTLFGKKKGSSDPAPPVPPFGASSGKDKSSERGTRRFATRRETSSLTVTDLDSRYGSSSPSAQRAAHTPSQLTASAPAVTTVPIVAASPPASPAVKSAAPQSVPELKTGVTPVPASEGPKPDGATSPRRKKVVGKLASQFEQQPAAKDGAPAEKGAAPAGPRKIVVKRKAVKRVGDNDALSVSAELPPAPVAANGGGDKPVSPRRGTTGSHTGPAEPPAPTEPRMTAEELTKMAERRTNIFREIHETERTYCRALREIIDRYLNPMKESKWRDLVPRLFSNLAMIVGVNEELLFGLGELLSAWDPTSSRVGPLFQKMSPFMRLYNTYGNSYNEAIGLLTKSKEKDDFRDFLTQCRGAQPLDLEALLIQPVQRIPRYRLLLEDLFKVISRVRKSIAR